jgi:hypothetical protein
MAMIIFFGWCSIVIIVGIATVIFGVRHHVLEAKKLKNGVTHGTAKGN